MDTMVAFALAAAHKHCEPKVFDWEKAARLIRESGATDASAGLSGDWEWTGGKIFAHGKPVPKEDTYVYLASTHATPQLELNGELLACYRRKSETPGWDSDTYWPPEALAALAA